MRMIPGAAYDTHSQAEKRIFDRLRTALDESYTAYHSLKPARHSHKRFPEIDFVICSTEGLYVIEVKGGRAGSERPRYRINGKSIPPSRNRAVGTDGGNPIQAAGRRL